MADPAPRHPFVETVLAAAREALGEVAWVQLFAVDVESTVPLDETEAALTAWRWLVTVHLQARWSPAQLEATRALPWLEVERLDEVRKGLRALPWHGARLLPDLVEPHDGGARWSRAQLVRWIRAHRHAEAQKALKALLAHVAFDARPRETAETLVLEAQARALAATVGQGAPALETAPVPPGGFSRGQLDLALSKVKALYRAQGFEVVREPSNPELVRLELRFSPAPGAPTRRFVFEAKVVGGRVPAFTVTHAEAPGSALDAHVSRCAALVRGALVHAFPGAPRPSAPPRRVGSLADDAAALLELAASRVARPQLVLACCTLAEAALADRWVTRRPHDWAPALAVATARAWAHGRVGLNEVQLAISAAAISAEEQGEETVVAEDPVRFAAAAAAALWAARACLGVAEAPGRVARAAARARVAGEAQMPERLQRDLELLGGLERQLQR